MASIFRSTRLLKQKATEMQNIRKSQSLYHISRTRQDILLLNIHTVASLAQ